MCSCYNTYINTRRVLLALLSAVIGKWIDLHEKKLLVVCAALCLWWTCRELSLLLLHQEKGVIFDWHEVLLPPAFTRWFPLPVLVPPGSFLPSASPAEVDLTKLRTIVGFVSNVDWISSLFGKCLFMLELNVE